MPAESPKQQAFMAICKHDPQHAKGKCPSPEVAAEFAVKPPGGYRPLPLRGDKRQG